MTLNRRLTLLITILLLFSTACGNGQLQGRIATHTGNEVTRQTISSPSDTPTSLPPTATATTNPPTPTVQPTIDPDYMHLGWAWPADDTRLVGQAIGADGILYAVDESGVLYALVAPGEVRWKVHGPYKKASEPVLSWDGNTVYLLGDQQVLVAVSNDGKYKWSIKFKEGTSFLPLAAPDGSVYIMAQSGYRILPDGSRQDFTWPEWSTPVDSIFDNRGYLYTFPMNDLEIILPTKSINQTCPSSLDFYYKSIIRAQDTIVYTTWKDKIIALQAGCRVLWQANLKGANSLAFDGQRTIFAGNSSGDIAAFDANQGTLLWNITLDEHTGWAHTMAASQDSPLYVMSDRGVLLAFDKQGQQLWQQQLYKPGLPNAMLVTPERDLVLMQNGQLLGYTQQPALRAKLPTPIPTAVDRTHAEEEIASFMLDFIVNEEMTGKAERYRTGIELPYHIPMGPDLIVYAPPDFATTDPMHPTNPANPIQVWWFDNGRLNEEKDKHKLIKEFNKLVDQYISTDQWQTKGWGYYEFGILTISDDYQSAEVYLSAFSFGVKYFLIRSPSGGWWIYHAEPLWVV